MRKFNNTKTSLNREQAGIYISVQQSDRNLKEDKMIKKTFLYAALLAVSLTMVSTGCGDTSSDTTTDDSSATTIDLNENVTVITGSVVAAPVSSGSVIAKTSAGVTIAGPATTSSDGTYSLEIPDTSLSEEFYIESTGGTYEDEATSTADVEAGTLKLYFAADSLTAGSTDSVAYLRPSTTIIAGLIEEGETKDAAEAAFETAFGYIPDYTVAPADATLDSETATDAEKLAGLRAASFSQLTADLGIEPGNQFELLTALRTDLADGLLDGQDADGAEISTATNGVKLNANIQNSFANSFNNFHDGDKNQTGLASDEIGSFPFATTELTDTYKVEYVKGTKAASNGKTEFQLVITTIADGTAATGLIPTIAPMMNMTSHSHATPVHSITESSTAGTYDCIIYYVMASKMMDGTSMGFWDLKISIGTEEAHFFPPVMMAMGDTTLAKLKSSTDKIAGMADTAENRTYFVFNDTLVSMTSTYTFNIFLAAKASMMSFPAVSDGTVLQDETPTDWTVSPLLLEASTDGTTWVTMTAGTDTGEWTAAGLTGLTDGTEGTIYVKLTINGTQYTTDGETAVGDGTNDYATFTVTPGSSGMSM